MSRTLERIFHNVEEYVFGKPGSFPGEVLAQYFEAGSYTFTAPDPNGDGQPYDVELWIKGAGGGGRGGAGNGGIYYTGSGGGEGETLRKLATLTPGQSYTVTVGQGGAPGAVAQPPNSTGVTGGSSSFGAVVSAMGGLGAGDPQKSIWGGVPAGGGEGGGETSFSNTEFRTKGNPGQGGQLFAGSAITAGVGIGGGPQELSYDSTSGVKRYEGVFGGGGGGGTASSNGYGAGSSGGDGYVMIWRV